jgi:peptide/nickel transport system permease protein
MSPRFWPRARRRHVARGVRPRRMQSFLQNRKALLGCGILAVFAAAAVVGPWFFPEAAASVAAPQQPPSAAHPLGTTALGQDVLAQTLVGARTTLAVGFAVGLGAVLLSILIGVTAGLAGGAIDDVLTVLTNVFLVIPGLPLAIVIAAFLPPGPISIAGVLTVTGWSWNARVLRAQTLSLREKDFVAAAIVGGESRLRIISREILPNMASLVASCFIGATTYAIGAQVGLEFLGLGDTGMVTWGTNLYWATNDAALVTGAWWTFVPTGLCLALVGFALTLINFAIDELTNPRLQAEQRFGKQFDFRGALGCVRRSAPATRRADVATAAAPASGENAR